MKRVVQFSGGVGSWAAAKRVVEKYGSSDLVLLFADVKAEDEDTYRFLHEGAANIGVEVTVIADGRTPREVMRDERMIGNSRIDPCSKILKRKLLDRWHKENCDPADTIIYFGIDWSEINRIATIQASIDPWKAEAPLCEKPLMSKGQCKEWAIAEGLTLPRLYDAGFSHGNCGGACIKAGQAQWALLLRFNRPLYLEWEDWEIEMRAEVGDHSILRDRSGEMSKPLTLREFRLRIEAGQSYDLFDWGGCGCAT